MIKFLSPFYILFFIMLWFSCTENHSHLAEPITTSPQKEANPHLLSNELTKFGDTLNHSTGVYVLEKGNESLISRAWLCEHAEESIDIQYFIFASDNVGLIACDYLVKAADRGVKVRILLDDIMVDADINDLLSLASHPNIKIKIYNPGINLGKNLFSKLKKLATDFRSANQRMHNKTFTVDGKVVITGGRNVADEYFDFDHDFNFRDRDVLLLGKVVPTIQQSFTTYWTDTICKPVESLVNIDNYDFQSPQITFKKLHEYAADTLNFWPQVKKAINNLPLAFENIKSSDEFIWVEDVTFVADLPGKNNGTNGLKGGGITTDTLAALINSATRSIEIQTPYLITTEESRALLKAATERGVTIRILTNSLLSNDNLEAFNGYQRDRKKLLNIGVEIHEFKPNAKVRYDIMNKSLQEKLNYQPVFGLHAKTMVIDSEISIIGTFNFDPRSSNLNTECLTIIRSKKITKNILKGIEIEFLEENSWKTTYNYNPDQEASVITQLKTLGRGIVPKDIL